MELTPNIKKAIQRYAPVEAEGLTLYPVVMAEREEFEYARPAIDMMQQSMPPVYAAMPLLSAYYKMDYEAAMKGEEPVGLFAGALLMLALSLRLGTGLTAEERLGLFRLKADGEDMSCLLAVTFWADGEELHSVTPVQFQRLREIIAAQNGIELTPEDANAELVEAERALHEMEGAALSGDAGEKIAAVCALCRVDEDEVEQWPILKFQTRAKTWQRIIGFAVCGVAQAQGGRWKGGNPYPSMFYERTDRESGALRPINEVTRGMTAQ
jgi:hypothetical protein